MIEQLIYLEGIEPADLYGVNDTVLNRIRSVFPKLKIVARGNEIRVYGDQEEISRFDDLIHDLIEHLQKYNRLSESDLDKFLAGEYRIAGVRQELQGVLVYGNDGKLITARTVNQRKLVESYNDNDLLFAIGPAGTGKTYTAIALAVKAFKNKEVKKIILTRPAVEAGERLGFLPGDLKEKLDPYLQPLYDALNDMIPSRRLKGYLEDGTIQIAPLAYMRGRTLDNAAVILDEAQNSTTSQLKMFLTRMGRSAKFIVTGDITQIDLPDVSKSGLVYALRILGSLKGLAVVYFDERDIIRHRLVKLIVRAYEEKGDEEARNTGK
jgi:phosphate starvation-inducible protein PhoH and related proteins